MTRHLIAFMIGAGALVTPYPKWVAWYAFFVCIVNLLAFLTYTVDGADVGTGARDRTAAPAPLAPSDELERTT